MLEKREKHWENAWRVGLQKRSLLSPRQHIRCCEEATGKQGCRSTPLENFQRIGLAAFGSRTFVLSSSKLHGDTQIPSVPALEMETQIKTQPAKVLILQTIKGKDGVEREFLEGLGRFL